MPAVDRQFFCQPSQSQWITMPTSHVYSTFRQDAVDRKADEGVLVSSRAVLNHFLLKAPTTNVLLLAVIPAAICYYGSLSTIATLFFCFIGLMALIERTNSAIDCLFACVQHRETQIWLQILLNNFVDITICIVALSFGLKRLVLLYIIGSSLLLVFFATGCCCLYDGALFHTTHFNTNLTQVHSMVLLFFASCIASPEVLFSGGESTFLQIEGFSRAAAIISLLVYISYIVFQVRSHTSFFIISGSLLRIEWAKLDKPDMGIVVSNPLADNGKQHKSSNEKPQHTVDRMQIGTSTTLSIDAPVAPSSSAGTIEPLSLAIILIFFIIFATLFSWTTVMLVGTFTVSDSTIAGLPSCFIVTILLPIAMHWCELVTVFQKVNKSKLSEAIHMGLSFSIQKTLFVFPSMVLLAWAMGQNLTYCVGSSESAIVFLAALVSNTVLRIGESNWFVGIVMIFLYLFVVIGFAMRDCNDLKS